MLRRQRTGSVVCPGCGRLVGVNDAECYNCGRRNPSLWGFSKALQALGDDLGFAHLVVALCGVLYLATLAIDPHNIRFSPPLGLLIPSTEALFRFGASGAIPIFGYGRWWTVLAAGWLHGGLLHIAFNMLWLRQLAPAVASVFGPSRMMILYVTSSAIGFAASSSAAGFLAFLPSFLRGAPLTVGASAGVFGLLGAIVSWGRRGGSEHASQQAWSWALVMFLMGFFPGLAVDNWAHLGGFLGGYLGAIVLDPRRRETPGDAILALVCLVATPSPGRETASVRRRPERSGRALRR